MVLFDAPCVMKSFTVHTSKQKLSKTALILIPSFFMWIVELFKRCDSTNNDLCKIPPQKASFCALIERNVLDHNYIP